MGQKLPWLLMGGGAAVILISCWCRLLLDLDHMWLFVAIVVGLGMIIAGKLIHTDDGDGGGQQ